MNDEQERLRAALRKAASKTQSIGEWLDMIEALIEGALTEAPLPAPNYEDVGREIARFGLRIVTLARAGVRVEARTLPPPGSEAPTLPPPPPGAEPPTPPLGPVLVATGGCYEPPAVESDEPFFEDGRADDWQGSGGDRGGKSEDKA